MKLFLYTTKKGEIVKSTTLNSNEITTVTRVSKPFYVLQNMPEWMKTNGQPDSTSRELILEQYAMERHVVHGLDQVKQPRPVPVLVENSASAITIPLESKMHYFPARTERHKTPSFAFIPHVHDAAGRDLQMKVMRPTRELKMWVVCLTVYVTPDSYRTYEIL